jgi:Helix-turn-helix domain of resolvase
VEDWAEIRRLHRAEGMPIRKIVRATGVSRNAVRRALAADGPPKYERPAKGSVVDAVEPRVRELLTVWPTVPATVIAERIGWEHSLTVLKVRVRQLRPLFVPPDRASRVSCGCRNGSGAFAGVGLGQRGRGPVLAGRPAEVDRPVRGLPWDSPDPGGSVPPGRPGGQGAGPAGERLSGDQFPSRPHVRFPGRLQRAARALAGQGQQQAAPRVGLPPGRPAGR